MKNFLRSIWGELRTAYLRWKYRTRFQPVDLGELPDRLDPRRVYVLGIDHPWSAVMICPCGCGEPIHLSLLRDDSPRWELSIDPVGLPTLSPSVWRTKGCRSHFFLRQGEIVWCMAERLPTNMNAR